VCQQEENCTFAAISSDEFEPVLLPSMSRHSFYVTLTTDDLVYQHLSDSPAGINYDDVEQASDSELTVYTGASVLKYPLELADPSTDFRPGGFIGRLIYEDDDGDFDQPVSSCCMKDIQLTA
jgi:hypothetical protein